MRFWRRSSAGPVREARTPGASVPEGADAEVPSRALGRGRPQVQKLRSVEARVGNALALALFGVLAAGVLIWYYARAWSRPHAARAAVQAATAARAGGEMTLPALSIPQRPVPVIVVKADASSSAPPALQSVAMAGGAPSVSLPPLSSTPVPVGQVRSDRVHRATANLQRPLSGPLFEGASDPNSGGEAVGAAVEGGAAAAHADAGAGADTSSASASLAPSVVPATAASELGSLDLTLTKGSSIDCTLETAIDSTLPGLATCVTATDVFGASGKVVLLERGTLLVGETRSDVRAGQARLFVLWTTARTPNGVVVNLDSQGTDSLGRAGLPGRVERQWGERFGAAVMLSVIEGAVAAGVASQEKPGSSSVVIDPTGASDVLTEALRQSAALAPKIVKAQGDRIAILVERDIDFRSVYTLNPMPPSR